MSPIISSLMLPFADGLLPLPQRALFLRAEPEGLGLEWRDRLLCEQSFKPIHDRLAAHGFAVVRHVEEQGVDTALVALTKQKQESQALVARGFAALAPGGMLVVAGTKDTGAGSLEKDLKKALGAVTALSKHHCRILLARRPDDGALPPVMEEWQAQAGLRAVQGTGWLAQPGVYGWGKVDAGSALLAEQMDGRIGGRVADLGAGWGYLSLQALARCPAIAALDLLEAEGLAVEAAQANLAGEARARVLWADVPSETPARSYDWVLMNPPFHAGKASDVELGRAFIAAAARGLVRGGRLLMVANRHLPYESTLSELFARHRPVAETAQFKVIEAQGVKA